MSAGAASPLAVPRERASEAVAEIRPVSAWVLVGVASLTLWITEQVIVPVMVAQALMLGFSLWRRERPHPLQSGPIFLNLVMLGVTATTIQIALQATRRPSRSPTSPH